MSYLPDDLDSVQGEVILDKVFGNSANAFLVIEDMPSKDVAEVKQKVSQIDGVKSVTWIDSFVDISVPESMLPDVVKDIFYSTDGDSTLMMIQFDAGSADESTTHAIKDIKKLYPHLRKDVKPIEFSQQLKVFIDN